MRNTVLFITCFLCFISLCFAQCGIYTSPSGFVFNLDPLTTSQDYNSSTGFFYYQWNFCKNIKTPSVSMEPTPVLQMWENYHYAPLGFLPGIISSHPSGEGQGVQIAYANDVDLCRNGESRVATFILTCQPSVTFFLTNITEPELCQYTFEIQSKYACPVSSTTAASSISGTFSSISSISSISGTTSSSGTSGTPGGKLLVPLWITAISSLVIILLLVIVILVIVAGLSKAKGYMALSNGQVIEI